MTTLVLEQPDLIDRLEKAAIDQNTTPDTLLHTAIQEFLDKIEHQSVAVQRPVSLAPPEFLREAEAFARLKPELFKRYKGRVVAIHQGEVVEVGDDILTVHAAVIDKFGPVPCYVDRVTEETVHRVRIPSVWRKR